MLDRGHDESVIRKVMGQNLLRVMRAAEAVARPPVPAAAP
jgi:microsomal dipeptidase-like Zn-dependent dipeptidase